MNARRAGFAGWVLAGGALLVGCGSTRAGDPTLPHNGSTGEGGAAAGSANSGGEASDGRSGSTGSGASETGGSTATGDGGLAGNGGEASNDPVDMRPPRPLWDPPFSVGAPGWRDSSKALCENYHGDENAFDVWADSRGVFGIFATTCNILAGTSCGNQGVSLQFNDGTGWQVLYTVPPGPGMGSPGDMYLSGFDAGPVLLSGYLPDQLGIWRISLKGKATLDAPLVVTRPFTVGANLAYAVGLSNPEQVVIPDTLYKLTDDKWSKELTLPAPAQGIWADQDRIVIAGGDQAVYQKGAADADFVAIPGVPAGDYSAVWSFGPDDTWVGNQAAQLVHYDGSKWTVFETGAKDVSGRGIAQLWGSSDGQLFFRTYTEMGRYDGNKVELLLKLPAGGNPESPRVSIGGLWGISSKEVFVSVSDGEFNQYACGGQFMLFFDGKALHSF
ncbi:MAG: hypothetical protein ABIQ16_00310 [Polyangiaceae bacterium]